MSFSLARFLWKQLFPSVSSFSKLMFVEDDDDLFMPLPFDFDSSLDASTYTCQSFQML